MSGKYLKASLGKAEENHITKEQFLMELFGFFGRDLVNLERLLTYNPNDIFSFIEECAENKVPLSGNPSLEVQPTEISPQDRYC
jgi:hypothetical protein